MSSTIVQPRQNTVDTLNPQITPHCQELKFMVHPSRPATTGLGGD